MRGGVRAGRPRPLPDDRDSDSALDALTAEELRAFVRDSLAALEDEPRGVLLFPCARPPSLRGPQRVTTM